MAYRKIHDTFWADPDIEDWTPDQKYFYIYLITNAQQTAVGVMPYSVKRIAFELGWSKESVDGIIKRMVEDNRIALDIETKEMYISRFYRYNRPSTDNHKAHVAKVVSQIKSLELKDQVIADITAIEGSKPAELPAPKKSVTPSDKPINIPFEDAFKLYGKPDDKAAAQRIWVKMSDENRQLAYDGINRFKEVNPDIKFRPYFRRYLSGARWNDVITIKRPEHLDPMMEQQRQSWVGNR